ncbi:hypothetical protein [Gillisia marina]|uniref:hypothetical protein n=1 Tax=Gillisia marina TaxID=1167637 RepID=UPI00029AA482|nr:hypothetical protein [Gillisia marina]
MDPFISLQNYIATQKKIGLYFIVLGVFLLSVAAVSYSFNSENLFFNGLLLGCMITGSLIIFGGFLYRNFNTKLFISAEGIYNKDKAIFLKKETERMAKVLENFSSFQTVFTIIIILAIGVIISFKIPFVSGICLAISLLFLGIMILGAISKVAIKLYYEELLKAHSSNFILQGLD